jgi:hypothetical protein
MVHPEESDETLLAPDVSEYWIKTTRSAQYHTQPQRAEKNPYRMETIPALFSG